MPVLELKMSEADAQSLVRVLLERRWAGEDDVSLVLWLSRHLDITPNDAASLYSNFHWGFDFGLDAVLDSSDDEWSSPPSPSNLIFQAAFELGKNSRDAVRKRREAWETRFFYGGIIMAIPCVLQGLAIVHFPLAFLCAIVGGLLAGALAYSDSVIAGIGGGAITGACFSLAFLGYSRIRHAPSGVEVALLLGLASVPGVITGALLKDLHRRLRWRSQVADMRTSFALSDADLRFPDKLKPAWRMTFSMLGMPPIALWLVLTNLIRRFIARLFGRPHVLR